jgi:hypothetical protein
LRPGKEPPLGSAPETVREIADSPAGVRLQRITMSYARNVDVKLRHSPHRLAVLLRIEAKRGPAGGDPGPGDDGVTTEESAPFRPVEAQVPGRVTRSMHHVQGADPVTVVNVDIDPEGRVLPEPERRSELEWEVRPQRSSRHDRDRLRCSLAAENVGLPLVRVHLCAALLHEYARATEMGTVRMRDHDVL